jgi:hypothetical protein
MLASACGGGVDSRPPNSTALPDPGPPPVEPVEAVEVEPVAEPGREPPAPPVAPPPDEQTPRFREACVAGDTITIAAVGDLLLHHELQIQAYASPDNFRAVWGGSAICWRRRTSATATSRGPWRRGWIARGVAVGDPGLVFDKRVYSSYPRFNFHASLLDDLVASGIDVVSTANNHALDREPLGVDATIAALGRPSWRTRGRGRAGRGAVAHDHAGARDHGGVAGVHREHQQIGPTRRGRCCAARAKGALEREVRALIAEPVDAVIVTPHWGKEYQPEPTGRSVTLAQRWPRPGRRRSSAATRT